MGEANCKIAHKANCGGCQGCKPKPKHPAIVLADIALHLRAGDEKGFEQYMDGLTKEELMATGQYTDAIQALILDSLARLEANTSIIVPK